MTFFNSLIPLLAVVILALVLVTWRLLLTPRNSPGIDPDRRTQFWLLLLRLAIGWHLLFEGIEKLNDPAWTSEGYLREAAGPLAGPFRRLAGDSVLKRLVPIPPEGLPPALQRDFTYYHERFCRYYTLSEEQQKAAQTALEQSISKTRTWLTVGKSKTPILSKYPPEVSIEKTVAERVRDYEKAQEQVAKIEAELTAEGQELWDDLREAKARANQIRNALKKDLEGQYRQLSDALHLVLKSMPGKKEGTRNSKLETRNAMSDNLQDPNLLKERPENAGRPPSERGRALWAYFTARPLTEWSLLRWSDTLVRYGLVIIGGCLLLGLLTRTACVAGALMLLLFFLARPPLPWLPEPPRSEGHYLYINKNIIEMLALLALATTRSGRWLGLDGLFGPGRSTPAGQPSEQGDLPALTRPGAPALTPPGAPAPGAPAPTPPGASAGGSESKPTTTPRENPHGS